MGGAVCLSFRERLFKRGAVYPLRTDRRDLAVRREIAVGVSPYVRRTRHIGPRRTGTLRELPSAGGLFRGLCPWCAVGAETRWGLKGKIALLGAEVADGRGRSLVGRDLLGRDFRRPCLGDVGQRRQAGAFEMALGSRPQQLSLTYSLPPPPPLRHHRMGRRCDAEGLQHRILALPVRHPRPCGEDPYARCLTASVHRKHRAYGSQGQALGGRPKGERRPWPKASTPSSKPPWRSDGRSLPRVRSSRRRSPPGRRPRR